MNNMRLTQIRIEPEDSRLPSWFLKEKLYFKKRQAASHMSSYCEISAALHGSEIRN